MNDLILYTTEDGRSKVKLRAKDQTVWLSQREMAQLFDVSADNIGLHLKNLYEDRELSREATAEDSSVVQIEGAREVQRSVTLYNTLNRLVVIFLETAELRAKSKQETRMGYWRQNVDQIISSNGFPLLNHAGAISHEQMEQRTAALYLEFDLHRKMNEAAEADLQDEADIRAVENKLKHRTKK